MCEPTVYKSLSLSDETRQYQSPQGSATAVHEQCIIWSPDTDINPCDPIINIILKRAS